MVGLISVDDDRLVLWKLIFVLSQASPDVMFAIPRSLNVLV